MNGNIDNKRRFVRANFPCKITISTPQEYSIETHTENISAGGVRVILEDRLETSLIVKLEVSLNGNNIGCAGRVVWIVKKESSYKDGFFTFDIGIEFYEISDKDRETVKEMVESIALGQKST